METTLSLLQEQLKVIGITLPPAPSPGGSYDSLNIRGSIAYVAIQFPIQGEQYLYQGRLGQEVSTTAGYQAARLAAINVLAQLEKWVKLERLLGLNHMDLYYQGSEGWDDAPLIANGASELFLAVLGEKGRHSRAIMGVHLLPRNFSVGISCSFTLNNS